MDSLQRWKQLSSRMIWTNGFTTCLEMLKTLIPILLLYDEELSALHLSCKDVWAVYSQVKVKGC